MPAASQPPTADRRTNVVVILVDTMGARHSGFLTTGPRTPNVDRLAGQGVAFRRAWATSSWTQPSVASLLTSRMPSEHGLLRLFDPLDERETTLPEVLRASGYETGAVVSHFLLGAKYGFAQGLGSLDDSAVAGHEGISSAKVTDLALAFLKRRSSAPFFLLVHYFDPHYVYQHHPEFDLTQGYKGKLRPGMPIWDLLNVRRKLTRQDVEYVAALHREEVAFADSHVGRLLDGLRDFGLDEDTLVVFAGDHGEEFMEHGWIGHTKNLYEEVLRVPLVFRLGRSLGPAVVDEPVSLIDVFPTVLELLGRTPARRTWQGASLVSLLRGRSRLAPERIHFAEVSFGVQPQDPAHMAEKSAFKTAAVSGRLKVVHDLTAKRFEAFDLEADPREAASLDANGTRFRRLRQRLLAWERERGASRSGQRPGRLQPSESDIKALRSLGYLK